MGTTSNNEIKNNNNNIKRIDIYINVKDSNALCQESTVDRIPNGNSDCPSQQLNSNINENKTGDASNEFSIFNSTYLKQDIEIEKEKEKKIKLEKESETKKGNFDPFSGGQIDENPTKGNSPTGTDNIDLFSGRQMKKDTPDNTETTTEGRCIDINLDRASNFGKHNKDNNIDNSNISISYNDHSNFNNNNIYNNNNKDNIKGNNEEEEKKYTNDISEEDKKEYANVAKEENDEQSEISNHFKKIKNICNEEGKFPFFLKINDKKPEFLLVNKNQTLRNILKIKNIDDSNISIVCKENKVFPDETFEKQELKNYCIIEVNELL